MESSQKKYKLSPVGDGEREFIDNARFLCVFREGDEARRADRALLRRALVDQVLEQQPHGEPSLLASQLTAQATAPLRRSAAISGLFSKHSSAGRAAGFAS